MQELIKVIIKRNGLKKEINVTDYTLKEFAQTLVVYANAGYDVTVKRMR